MVILVPVVVEFVAGTRIHREADLPQGLPIVGNGPPGTFVLFAGGFRVSLPTDQIVYADERDDRVCVGFGGMAFDGLQEGRLVFTRVREVQPEDRLSPARSHVMRLDPSWVSLVTVDGDTVWSAA